MNRRGRAGLLAAAIALTAQAAPGAAQAVLRAPAVVDLGARGAWSAEGDVVGRVPAPARTGCAGHFAPLPQARLRLADGDRYQVWAPRTAILVRGPDGSMSCSPEGRAIPLAGRGIHEVFVGSAQPGVTAPYRLGAARVLGEIRRAGVVVGRLDPAAARALDHDEEDAPAGASATVAALEPAGFSKDFVGRTSPGRGATCDTALALARAPAHRLHLDADAPGLVFALTSQAASGHVLVVRGPDGAARCAGLSTVVAGARAVEIAPAPRGVYEIYVAGHHPGRSGLYQVRALVLDVDQARGAPSEVRLAIGDAPPDFEPPHVEGGVSAAAPIRSTLAQLGGGRPGPEAAAARHAALAAVVRLRAGERFVCTATVIERAGQVELLTAAHCLFGDAGGRLGARRSDLRVDALPPLDLARARVSPAFEACAQEQRRYVDCVTEGAADVALIPLREPPPAAVAAWRLCSAAPTDRELTVLGYGLDRGALPGVLLGGAFSLSATPDAGLWQAVGFGVQQVAHGDSGGPAMTARDDDEMASRAPEVCFVVAGVMRGDPFDPAASGTHALLQPIWDAP